MRSTGRDRLAAEPAEDAVDDAWTHFGRATRGRCRCNGRTGDLPGFLRLRAVHRGRLLRGDALHRGGGPLRLGFRSRLRLGFFGHFDHLVGGWQHAFLIQIVVPQPLHLVVRCIQMDVRNERNVDLQPRLERMDVIALFVQQERGDVHRNLRVDCGAVFLHRLLLDDAQDVEGGRFDRADEPDAAAARTRLVRGLAERRPQSLPRQFHETEAGDLAHLHPGAVVPQGIAEPVFNLALIARVFHVDEIDDDQAAQVTQPQLT